MTNILSYNTITLLIGVSIGLIAIPFIQSGLAWVQTIVDSKHTIQDY